MISRDEPPSPLEQLPDEMLLHTLSFFNKKELGSIAPVNKNFNSLVNVSFNDRRLDYTQPQLDQIRNFHNDNYISQVEWLSDTEIASLSSHSVKIWNVHTQACLKTFRLTELEFNSEYFCCFKKIGDKLFIGTNAGALYQWDYKSKQPATTCIRYIDWGDYKNCYERYGVILDIIPLPRLPDNKILLSFYDTISRCTFVKIFNLDNHQEEDLNIYHPVYPFGHDIISNQVCHNNDLPQPFFFWERDKLVHSNRLPLIELPGKRIAMAVGQMNGASNGGLCVFNRDGIRLFENTLYKPDDKMIVHINSLCLVSEHIVLVGVMERNLITNRMAGGQLYHWDLEKNTLTKQILFDSQSGWPWPWCPDFFTLHSIKKGPNGNIILAYGSEIKFISYPLLTPTIENNNDNHHLSVHDKNFGRLP